MVVTAARGLKDQVNAKLNDTLTYDNSNNTCLSSINWWLFRKKLYSCMIIRITQYVKWDLSLTYVHILGMIYWQEIVSISVYQTWKPSDQIGVVGGGDSGESFLTWWSQHWPEPGCSGGVPPRCSLGPFSSFWYPSRPGTLSFTFYFLKGRRHLLRSEREKDSSPQVAQNLSSGSLEDSEFDGPTKRDHKHESDVRSE